MLKVLIADDEELVRQLIKRLVDWNSLGLEIVAEAGSGYEAYDLLVEHVPDIAIVDIRMPGFDGLTLIRKTRELNLDVRFVLISGYKQFEYAHEALTMGVQHYILKPIRKDELTKNLIQIRDAVFAANEAQQSRGHLHAVAERSAARLRNQFLKDLVLYKSVPTGNSTDQINVEYGFRFSEGVFQFVLCKESEGGSLKDDTSYDKTCLIELFEKTLRPICHDLEHYYFNHRFCFLVNYDPSAAPMVDATLKTLFSMLSETADYESGEAFTLAVGKPVEQISCLNQAFRNADHSLNSRFFRGAGKLLPPVEIGTVTLDELITDADERKFSELFDFNDGEKLKKWMQSVLSRAFACENNPTLIIDLSYRLVDMFYKRAKNLRRREEGQDTVKENIYQRIACADSREKLFALISSVVDERYDSSAAGGSAHVRFVKEYIKEHYREDIRLSEIAKMGNVNSAYLSRIFSEEVGETFSDYLISYRIQAAKELLCDISINVSEVAERVGYSDVKHFSKSFKKIVGISPKDYRKLHAR